MSARFRVLLAVAGLGMAGAEAAYLIEVDTDGLDDGVLSYDADFSFGGDTTAASQSAPSAAVGMNGGDSIFGGNGSALPDTYVFTHSPDSQPDNLLLDAGTPLGNGDFASGAAGGIAGRYAVYAIWPATSNVSGGPTHYQIDTAGSASSSTIDQNGPGGFGSLDLFGGVWVKLGEVDYSSGPITVTQTAGSNTSVSMRAAGVLFERLSQGGTPGYTGPPGVVVFGEGPTRSLGIAFKRSRTEALSTHFAVVESTNLSDWSTTDLKLVSIIGDDADDQLVTFRSMTPMAATERRFLGVRPVPKMPVGPSYVAITFDDGPHPDRTPRLLDLLAERNIRATFYLTGINAGWHPQVVRRMLNEGHEIGNHTQSHARLTDLTLDGVRAEVDGCRDAVVAAATLPPMTIRPPYGAVDQTLRDLFLSEYGYPTVLWNVDPRDWDTAVSDQQVIDTILGESDPGEIILCHDIHERTINLMPTVLDGLLARGFTFVTVSELLALQGN